MSVTAHRYTAAAVEQRGWSRGSSLEDRVALLLSDEGFTPGDFYREYPIGRYRIDFAIPELRIAVEADGYHHRMPGKPERDALRDVELFFKGWTTLRISDEDPDGMRARVAEVAAVIRKAMKARPAKSPIQLQYELLVDPRGVLHQAQRSKQARSAIRARIARLQCNAMKRRRLTA